MTDIRTVVAALAVALTPLAASAQSGGGPPPKRQNPPAIKTTSSRLAKMVR